jgi:hypothetical protein
MNFFRFSSLVAALKRRSIHHAGRLAARDAPLSVIDMRLQSSSAVALILCGLVAGCADFARWTRRYTYPPDFRYIERDQLRSAMWQLARHVRELDQHLRLSTAGEQQRKDVLEHLDGMESATRTLDNAGWPSNHPMIDMNMPKLRQDIRLARDAVERTPPNYALAYSLPGACVYCHGGR